MKLERVKLALLLLALVTGWSPLHAEVVSLQVSDGVWQPRNMLRATRTSLL